MLFMDFTVSPSVTLQEQLLSSLAFRPTALLKRDSGAGVFQWILQKIQEQLFLQKTPGQLLLTR